MGATTHAQKYPGHNVIVSWDDGDGPVFHSVSYREPEPVLGEGEVPF